MQYQLVALFIVATLACCMFWGACRGNGDGFAVLTQALPEWRRQNTQQDGKLTKQGSHKWKQNLCKFLGRKGVKMQKTNLKAKDLANKHHIKAYGHAWQAVGLGVASCVGQNKCVRPRDQVHGAQVVAI